MAGPFAKLVNEHCVVFHSYYPAQADSANIEKYRRKARLANKLSIAGLVALFIPIVNLLSLPTGILAIIFGSKAKKHLPEKTLKKVMLEKP